MHAAKFASLGLPFAALLIAGSAAATDKKKSNLSDKPAVAAVESSSAERITLGYRMADYARATKDARAMIVAARIVDAVPVKAGTDKGKLSGNGAAAAARTVTTGSAAELFAEAKQLAAGDQDILAAVAAAQAEASKGCACGGAIRTVQYVPGQTVWTVRFSWRGGEPMAVGARRDSAVPMTMKIYDENGYLVCQDVTGNVTMYCRFNPIWTGAFAVQITNLGAYGSGVALVTN